MIAKLEFTLPEDREEFEAAQKGHLGFLVIHELYNEIRRNLKYNDELTDEQRAVYEKIREFVNEKANEYGVESLL